MRDITYCMPVDKDNELCKNCKRNVLTHKEEGIRSMSEFKPRYSEIQSWHCDGYIEEK